MRISKNKTNLVRHPAQELWQNDFGTSKTLWENKRRVHITETHLISLWKYRSYIELHMFTESRDFNNQTTTVSQAIIEITETTSITT